jgi:ketosteroid isomerase-like protein
MYRLFVRRIVRKAFGNINADDYERVLPVFARDVVFCFAGDHAMGGEIKGPVLVREWFERVFRLFPDIRLEPKAVVVMGPPWRTFACTRFVVRGTLPDGRQYTNEGMQFLHLRWGKAVEDRLYEDTAVLVDALDAIAASGNDEAAAAPLGPLPAAALFVGTAS